MKKLLFVLLLSLVCSAMYAQVRPLYPDMPVYANGDSYGFYIEEIPGAVSYEWSVQGANEAVIWPADPTAVDLTFSYPGMYDLICTVTMSNGSVEDYALVINVYEEEN
jgi:hypothetical protein